MSGWLVLMMVVAAIAALDLLAHYFAARPVLPLFERKVPFFVEPSPPDPDAERISFPTSHGLTLRGSIYRSSEQPPRGLILFCPEFDGNHWSAMSYAEALRDAGYTVLSFDVRNQGESDSLPGYEPLHWLTEHEVTDVLAAIRYIESREDLAKLPLGLFGISRGGGAALAAACRCPKVKAVACEGAYSTESLLLHYAMRWATLYIPGWIMRMLPMWHIHITLALARTLVGFRRGTRYTLLERELPRLADRPVLMVAGGRDTYVSPSITDVLRQRIGPSAQPVWIVTKAKHNEARKIDRAGYDQRLIETFEGMPAGAPFREPLAAAAR